MMVYLKGKDTLRPVGLVHLVTGSKLRKIPCTRLENKQVASMCHQPLGSQCESHLTFILPFPIRL